MLTRSSGIIGIAVMRLWASAIVARLSYSMRVTASAVYFWGGPREVRGFDAGAWNEAVPELLVRGNIAKFAQNADLLAFLRSTTGKRLIEGSPLDRIYGVGLAYDDPMIEDEANWLGRNLLGNALETVRVRLA